MASTDSGTPGDGEGQGRGQTRRRVVMVAVFLVAAVLGFFLFRRPPVGSDGASASGTASSGDAVLVSTAVELNSKAALIADRYNCMCGECSDRLGACNCVHAAGANEMKATLNEMVKKHQTLEEIDAAMVEKYGDRVLVSFSVPSE